MSKAVPLSNEKRFENYQKQNAMHGPDKWLTVAQKRAIRKGAKRNLKKEKDA